MANQLRDLEHRDGMLTDIMTRTCDGQAAGECQGRISRRMEAIRVAVGVKVHTNVVNVHVTPRKTFDAAVRRRFFGSKGRPNLDATHAAESWPDVPASATSMKGKSSM